MLVKDLAAVLSKAQQYDLAQPLEDSTPAAPLLVPFRLALLRRHGDSMGSDGSSSATEALSLSAHVGTHIDALCHFASFGKLHGGVDAVGAVAGGRFRELGAETIPPLLCRAILLDIARAKGVECLAPGYAVTGADLSEACRQESLSIDKGDAVLIRTGWSARHYSNRRNFLGLQSGVPGPDLSGARWLADRFVAVTGADTLQFECWPMGGPTRDRPVHTMLLVEKGIYIMELLNLEPLAERGVTEFVLAVLPLRLVGATASPIRPIAIVP